jgi:hypothetical protein
MNYTRARFYLGVASIGFWMALSAYALLTNLPTTLFPVQAVTWLDTANHLLLAIGVYLLLTLPFDVIGGVVLPMAYKQPAPNIAVFALQWLRGALVQGALWLIFGLLLTVAAAQSGNAWFLSLVVSGILMLALVTLQTWVGFLISGFRPKQQPFAEQAITLDRLSMVVPKDLSVYQTNNPTATGVINGAPGMERIMIPSTWLKQFEGDTLAGILLRYITIVQNESRQRAVWIVVIYYLIGFWLMASNRAISANLDNITGVLQIAFGMTLWSAAALVLLTPLTRWATLEADHSGRREGIQLKAFEDTISQISQTQHNYTPDQQPLQIMFQPIPDEETRILELTRRNVRYFFTTWGAARLAPYVSWVYLNPLSRAADYMLGRPDFWATPPND